MFAPTIQGRQFAMGSLETRKVINPKNPLEKKISIIYYDISGSMNGPFIEVQDALLMAFVDKALSETDAIGRTTHEVYLVPFNDNLGKSLKISSREDAYEFLTKKMNQITKNDGGTQIQQALENFYDIVSASYKKKSAQGREKLFQKANMILFTDGKSTIDIPALESKRNSIPSDVKINMNLVSFGDAVNKVLESLSKSNKLSSSKPTFRQLDSKTVNAIADISVKYDPNAFATNQRITGSMLAKINTLLDQMHVDTRLEKTDNGMNQTIAQIQITKKDISQLSGLREIMNLTQITEILTTLNIKPLVKKRLVQAIIDNYQNLSKRSWKEMTYPEKDSFKKLQQWSEHSLNFQEQ